MEDDEELSSLLAKLESQQDELGSESDDQEDNHIIQLPSAKMSVERIKEPDAEQDMAKELIIKFNTKFDLIGARELDDRQKLKSVIGYLEGLIFNVNDPKVGYVEQLVASYKVLVDSNMNSTKSLDALSRILSAGKGTTIMLNNVNNQSPQDEIIGLLDEDDL